MKTMLKPVIVGLSYGIGYQAVIDNYIVSPNFKIFSPPFCPTYATVNPSELVS